MKKLLLLLLAFLTCLSVCACGGDEKQENTSQAESKVESNAESKPEENVKRYKVGETVSTDIAKFTLDETELTIALNNTIDENYLTPKAYDAAKDSKNPYVAPTGHTFAYLSYTLENLDRTDLNIGLTAIASAEYNGKTYGALKTRAVYYYVPHSVYSAGTLITEKAFTWHSYNSTNSIIGAGEKESYRGYIDISENITNFNEKFELVVKLPDSKGEKVEFVFTSK